MGRSPNRDSRCRALDGRSTNGIEEGLRRQREKPHVHEEMLVRLRNTLRQSHYQSLYPMHATIDKIRGQRTVCMT
jgi:hypothetical protein